MKIAIGSDHRGLILKDNIIRHVADMGYEPIDCGAYNTNSVDYPDIAISVGQKVISGQAEYGILICGTGIGMSIAANKIKGIRAALCCDSFMAERARLHNNANILCLGAEKTIDIPEILHVFLTSAYEKGRHQKRLAKIAGIENC